MRPEKETVISDLKQRFNASPFLLLVDYAGLTVAQFAELRNRLVAAGAKCTVVKNSFIKRAAKEAGMPDVSGSLTGQTALVTGESDVCAAAKVVKSFAAEFEKPTFKMGILDGKVLSSDEVKALADLPSREILLAQLLGVLQAPASKLVRTLNEPASAFARLLKAKADKEQA